MCRRTEAAEDLVLLTDPSSLTAARPKLLLLQKHPPLVHRSRSLELRSQLRPGGLDP
jgi:hypothetical protein